MIAAVIPLAGPELSVRVSLDYVSRLYKGFAKPELVVADCSREVRVTGGVGGIRFNHHLRAQPRLAGIVIRINQVVDENELAVGFGFVAKAEFCPSSRSFEGHLLAPKAVEAVA